jgi:hypothetical protein
MPFTLEPITLANTMQHFPPKLQADFHGKRPSFRPPTVTAERPPGKSYVVYLGAQTQSLGFQRNRPAARKPMHKRAHLMPSCPSPEYWLGGGRTPFAAIDVDRTAEKWNN